MTSGPVSRGGTRRVAGAAAAHDLAPEATGTPGGRGLPTWAERCVYGVPSHVTRDGLGARRAQGWEAVRERFAPSTTLVRQLEHGPAHQRRRTQWRPRLVDCVPPSHGPVRRASSPPSDSTDTPVERGGGILDHHGNGTWLDAIAPVLPCAQTMPWQGQHPSVALVTTTEETGVTLTKDAMPRVAAQITRLPDLGKWCKDIVPPG